MEIIKTFQWGLTFIRELIIVDPGQGHPDRAVGPDGAFE